MTGCVERDDIDGGGPFYAAYQDRRQTRIGWVARQWARRRYGCLRRWIRRLRPADRRIAQRKGSCSRAGVWEGELDRAREGASQDMTIYYQRLRSRIRRLLEGC
jgi:hypothetical protein